MYRASTASQIRFDDFNQGCGMQLDQNNEWIRMGDLIPWKKLEHLYSVYFPSKSGRPAHPFREALGTLIIQQRLTLSDRKTAKAIAEGPYLQYFIGLPRFQNKAPFQPSLLVEFRKRLTPEIMEQCNEVIIQALEEAEQKAKEAAPKKRGRKPSEETPDENGNLGTAILDATCAPSYILMLSAFSDRIQRSSIPSMSSKGIDISSSPDFIRMECGPTFSTVPRSSRYCPPQPYQSFSGSIHGKKYVILTQGAFILARRPFAVREWRVVSFRFRSAFSPSSRSFLSQYTTFFELIRSSKPSSASKGAKIFAQREDGMGGCFM